MGLAEQEFCFVSAGREKVTPVVDCCISGLIKMKYFSVRHSRHMLLTGLKPGAFASCLNLIDQ